MLVIVLANSEQEARQWAREEGLAPKEWVYPTVANIQGMADCSLVTLANYDGRHEPKGLHQQIDIIRIHQGGEWRPYVSRRPT